MRKIKSLIEREIKAFTQSFKLTSANSVNMQRNNLILPYFFCEEQSIFMLKNVNLYTHEAGNLSVSFSVFLNLRHVYFCIFTHLGDWWK